MYTYMYKKTYTFKKSLAPTHAHTHTDIPATDRIFQNILEVPVRSLYRG